MRDRWKMPGWLRAVAIGGGVVLLLLGVAAVFLGSIFPSVDDLCGNDELVETVSPNGKLKAVTFRRDCGATTSYSTYVSILPAARKLPNEAGNVFVQSREPIMVVRWMDDRHLNISGRGAGTALVHRTDWDGIRITYE